MRNTSLLFVLLLLSACVGSVNNLNPLSDVTKKNTVNKTPNVVSITVSPDRVTLTGSNLDQVTGIQITAGGIDKSMSLLTQTAGIIEAVVAYSPALSFYAQETYDLIVSSASGSTIYPINFVINSNTITTGMLKDYSVTNSKIGTRAVTYDKIAITGADDGDVLTYSSADGSWIAAPPTGGGAGGGGSVSSISRGSGLMNAGTSITTTGTIAVNVGSGSGQIQTLDSNGDFSFGNSIILNSQTVGEGVLSLLDSGATTDFQLYNTSNFHLQYSSNLTNYYDALIVKSDGEFDVMKNLNVAGSLIINTGGANSITFPTVRGVGGQTLITNGAGVLSWTTPAGGGTVTSITADAVSGLTGGTITGVGTIGINVGTGAFQIPQLDVTAKLNGNIIPSGISATLIGGGLVDSNEFDRLNGVLSPIQAQIDAKEPTLAAGIATQYYRGDKSWQLIQATDVTETGARKFMNIKDYAAIGALPLSGAADILQPVSERTVALLKESVASLSAPMANLNAKAAPAIGEVAVGNGATFDYYNFMTYLYLQLHPGGDTSLLIGNGVGSGTILAAGDFNVGVGGGAMAAITSGTSNTALGYQAHLALNTGTNNTAIGRSAQDDITSGSANTSVGANIMDNGATATVLGNTAVGYGNLRAVSGNYNSAFGYNALTANTSGANNVGIGATSGLALTSGGNNTFVGYGAGKLVTTSSSNTFLGHNAGATADTTSATSVVIGDSAGPAANTVITDKLYINNAASNTPLIGGNFSTKVVFINHDIKTNGGDLANGTQGLYVDGDAYKTTGSNTWTIPSDRRLKERIVPYDRGLEEILGLRPVRFHYKENPALGLSSKSENIGVIAQEVQEEFPESVITGMNGYLGFKLDPVIWGSVNAIHELNDKIEKLEKENQLLKSYLCRQDPKAPFCP